MDISTITDILVEFEDQNLAVTLLKNFTAKSQKHHSLIMNKELGLTHDEWKRLCDESKIDLENCVNEILKLANN